MRVRSISCRSCGGPKVTPSKSAYLYCDFCGRYMDWDFYRAVSSKEDRLPGPEYERLAAEIMPQAQAAVERGDREAHAELQAQLFIQHMNHCPASYSPRIGDPDYRAAMLEYMAEYYTLLAFDSELRHLNEALDAAVQGLVWLEREGSDVAVPDELREYRDVIAAAAQVYQCESESFWRMFRAFEAVTLEAQRKAEAAGLYARYPDEVESDTAGRTAYSIFAEAWLPYLSPDDQVSLLSHAGLLAEYREVDGAGLQERHCGRCGATRPTPQGAREVVCEDCGHKLDVGSGETPCSNCGAGVSLPSGFSTVACPYCETEIRGYGTSTSVT